MAAIGGHARVMIGPRSAIFAPLHDIGLIVVDEEHDASYKNEEGIYYHARDLAVALAGYSKCPVVLGSATPSSESYANARRGRYRLLRLLRRVNDRAMASVEVVDMRREVAESRKLAAARTTNGAGPRESKLKQRKFPIRCRSRRRWSPRCARISRRAARAWCFSTAAAFTIFCNATSAATLSRARTAASA